MNASKAATARTLRVLSAGAVKRGVARIAADFEKATGVRVTVEFATVPELRERVAAGEAADVYVASPAAMDEFARREKIVPDSRGLVGRSRMGVVVHANAALPDLGDTEAFKRVLLGASAVVHNRASSGIYAAQLLERLGLVETLGARIIVVQGGAAIMEYVAGHPPAAVGLAQISEVMVQIEKGLHVRLAGPLPDAIQNTTSYEAAAGATSAAPEIARALARDLTSDAAKQIFAATGIN